MVVFDGLVDIKDRLLGFLKQPLSKPEWAELLCAMFGLMQFVFAVLTYSDLPNKPGYALAVFFSVEAWTIGGLLLFLMHIVSLTIKDEVWGYRARLIAIGSSLTFWSHFIFSVTLNSVFFNGPFPITLIPSLGTPILAGALLYRLWKRY